MTSKKCKNAGFGHCSLKMIHANTQTHAPKGQTTTFSMRRRRAQRRRGDEHPQPSRARRTAGTRDEVKTVGGNNVHSEDDGLELLASFLPGSSTRGRFAMYCSRIRSRDRSRSRLLAP